MEFQRSFITHAHFYQPPREDPISNEVPNEPSAFPYHDWNEKIFETCYLPNIQIGNFSRISFDIGPTLSRWLRKHHPDALQKIVEADKVSVLKTGYGNAIAQPYHHTILPLATKQEKETEIIWGIEDFRHGFGRDPEGMWLPETAVDLETLGLLTDQGIKFTILAPWQIAPEVDIRRSPFLVKGPGGQEIAIFVYNAELSSRASFDSIATSNADQFMNEHVRNGFTKSLEKQYVMLATDGELYGHHQEYRDLFLSQLVNGSIQNSGLFLDFPAAWLHKKSEIPYAEIIENTSWSCHHGIARWREECGCTPGATWKLQLRNSLTDIARDIDFLCDQYFRRIGIDLDRSRHSYIKVLNGEIDFDDWILVQTATELTEREIKKLGMLFKAQEFRLRMFASCGWFFDRFDRIEPKNNLISSAFAVFLIEKALEIKLAQRYETSLSKIGNEVNGKDVFMEAYNRFQIEVN